MAIVVFPILHLLVFSALIFPDRQLMNQKHVDIDVQSRSERDNIQVVFRPVDFPSHILPKTMIHGIGRVHERGR